MAIEIQTNNNNKGDDAGIRVIGLKIEYTWIIHFSFNIILKLNQYDQ